MRARRVKKFLKVKMSKKWITPECLACVYYRHTEPGDTKMVSVVYFDEYNNDTSVIKAVYFGVFFASLSPISIFGMDSVKD